jgi:hypothetical protein
MGMRLSVKSKKAAWGCFFVFLPAGRLFAWTWDIAVFLPEAFDAARSVDDLLFAGIERVAGGAHFDVQFGLGEGRTGHERIAARAGDGNVLVLRVNVHFHGKS